MQMLLSLCSLWQQEVRRSQPLTKILSQNLYLILSQTLWQILSHRD